MKPNRPAFLEFFAGAGLVRLALEPQWRCAWANDVSEKKAAVYRANFGEAELHVGDVARVEADELPNAQLAWASFPCQDLSLAGWRRGISAPRSGTFWQFWRLMREMGARRPPLIVLENVVGLLHGASFGGLCEALADLDLRFGAMVIDAKWFLPQSRPRVFVVAVDASVDVTPWSGPEEVRTAVRQAFDALPAPLRERWVWWRMAPPAARVPAIRSLIEANGAAPEWFDPAEVERLRGMMTKANGEKLERALERPERSVGFLYRRTREGKQRAEVRFDGLAGCLRTPEGGSSRQTVVVVEDGEVRMRLLSAREAARLMGAPDSFELPERYNDAYRAMGDGVAVPAVRWLSEELLLPLVGTVGNGGPAWASAQEVPSTPPG
ncbi:MAG: DNA cytosine methyltransferase [Acidobacteria bacterium]|nr:DNA cytosine methyltransferase [Acidobacteriota bacterium]